MQRPLPLGRHFFCYPLLLPLLTAPQLNIIFLFIYRNNDSANNGDQNPDIYSQIMRNKLNRHGIIF